jgi:hypothetical protein
MSANNPEFQSFAINARGHQKADEIRHKFNDLLEQLKVDMLPSRELSIVKTKLEEACFFAVKYVASQNENQQ